MPTDVINTIGSGEDFATVAAWEAATRGDYVAADERRIGEVVGRTATTEAVFPPANESGADATRHRILRCRDRRDYWDPVTNDGDILTSDNYFYVAEHYFRLERVFVVAISSWYAWACNEPTASCDDSIFVSSYAVADPQGQNIVYAQTGVKVRNCLFIATNGAGLGHLAPGADQESHQAEFHNCLSVGPWFSAQVYTRVINYNCIGWDGQWQLCTGSGNVGDDANMPAGSITDGVPADEHLDPVPGLLLGDYRLKLDTSRARDYGSVVANSPPADVDGNSRSGAMDAGPYDETASGAPPGPSETGLDVSGSSTFSGKVRKEIGLSLAGGSTFEMGQFLPFMELAGTSTFGAKAQKFVGLELDGGSQMSAEPKKAIGLDLAGAGSWTPVDVEKHIGLSVEGSATFSMGTAVVMTTGLELDGGSTCDLKVFKRIRATLDGGSAFEMEAVLPGRVGLELDGSSTFDVASFQKLVRMTLAGRSQAMFTIKPPEPEVPIEPIKKTAPWGRHWPQKAASHPPSKWTVGNLGEGIQIMRLSTGNVEIPMDAAALFRVQLWDPATDQEHSVLSVAELGDGTYSSSQQAFIWANDDIEVLVHISDNGLGDLELQADVLLKIGGAYENLALGYVDVVLRPNLPIPDASVYALTPEWSGKPLPTPRLTPVPLLYMGYGGLGEESTDPMDPENVLRNTGAVQSTAPVVGFYDVDDDLSVGCILGTGGEQTGILVESGDRNAAIGARFFPPSRRKATPASSLGDLRAVADPVSFLATPGGSWDVAAWYRGRYFYDLRPIDWSEEDPSLFAWYPSGDVGPGMTDLSQSDVVIVGLDGARAARLGEGQLDFNDVADDVDRIAEYFGEAPIAQLYGWWLESGNEYPPEAADVVPTIPAAMARIDDAGGYAAPYIFPFVVSQSKGPTLFPTQRSQWPDGDFILNDVEITGLLSHVVSPLHGSQTIKDMARVWLEPLVQAGDAADIGGVYYDTHHQWGRLPDYNPALASTEQGWGAAGWNDAKDDIVEEGAGYLNSLAPRKRYDIGEWSNPAMIAADIQAVNFYVPARTFDPWSPLFANAFGDLRRLVTFYSVDSQALQGKGSIADMWMLCLAFGWHQGLLHVTYAQQRPDDAGRFVYSIPRETDFNWADQKWRIPILDASKAMHITARPWVDAYRFGGRRCRTPRNTLEREVEREGYVFEFIDPGVGEVGPTPLPQYGPAASVWFRVDPATGQGRLLLLITNWRAWRTEQTKITLDTPHYPWLRGRHVLYELDFPGGGAKAKTNFVHEFTIERTLQPLETIAFEVKGLAPLPVEEATAGATT